MGSMKQKRRKKLKKAWSEFQILHGLSDDDARQARQTGYTIKQLQYVLDAETIESGISTAERIQQLRREQLQKATDRQAEIEAELMESEKTEPRPRKPLNSKWEKAKAACRLNLEDIGKAKELGISPMSLIKNIPGPGQQWKAPVKVWIRELHASRFGSRTRATASCNAKVQQHAEAPATQHEASNDNSVATE